MPTSAVKCVCQFAAWGAEPAVPYNTVMEAYRAEATIELGGKLRLDHLPFKTGERVEVVVSASNRSEAFRVRSHGQAVRSRALGRSPRQS